MEYIISEEELHIARYGTIFEFNALTNKQSIELVTVNGVLTEGEISKIYINTKDYVKDLDFSKIYIQKNIK